MRREPLTRPTKPRVSRNKKPVPVVPQVPKTKAILVLRCVGGIGDMLMLTPAIRGIKELHKNLPVIVCTTDRYQPPGCLIDVLANNPFIEKTITVDKLIEYDFVKIYDFQTNKEAGIEVNPMSFSNDRIDIFCDLAGVKPESKKPVFVLTDKEKEWADKWINKNVAKNRRRLFGIHVSSSTFRRSWPQEKQVLLSYMILNKYKNSSVIFFESTQYSTPELISSNVFHIKDLPIRLVGALIDRCEVVVVPDSALLHIAGALDKKMVAIFGSTPPEARLLNYPNSVAVTMDYSCQPCWYERCHQGFKCLVDIPAEMVMRALEDLVDLGKTGIYGKSSRKGLCIIRMGGIGDLIMLSSAIKVLKKQKPELEITLATMPQHVDLYKGVSWLKDCISLGTFTKMIFENTIDLRYKVESPEVGGTLNTETYKTVNRMDIFEMLLGVKADKKDPEILVDQKSLEIVKKKIGWNEGDKWLGIQTTCTSNLRTFPPEYIESLVKKFEGVDGIRIVLFGKTEFWHGRRSYVDLKAIDTDGEGPKVVNIMDNTDLKELVALISITDFVVAPDSSALHIAGALRKKCLAVFGNIDPYTRIYYYPTVKPLYSVGELDCIPCHDFKNPCEHYRGMPLSKEPVGGKCMFLLTPDRIFNAGKEWFEL